MLTRKQWQPLQVPQCATVSETHGQWCTVRDMMHKVGAQPLDTGQGLQVLRLVRLARRRHTHRSPSAETELGGHGGGGGSGGRGLWQPEPLRGTNFCFCGHASCCGTEATRSEPLGFASEVDVARVCGTRAHRVSPFRHPSPARSWTRPATLAYRLACGGCLPCIDCRGLWQMGCCCASGKWGWLLPTDGGWRLTSGSCLTADDGYRLTGRLVANHWQCAFVVVVYLPSELFDLFRPVQKPMEPQRLDLLSPGP